MFPVLKTSFLRLDRPLLNKKARNKPDTAKSSHDVPYNLKGLPISSDDSSKHIRWNFEVSEMWYKPDCHTCLAQRRRCSRQGLESSNRLLEDGGKYA